MFEQPLKKRKPLKFTKFHKEEIFVHSWNVPNLHSLLSLRLDSLIGVNHEIKLFAKFIT